MRYHPTLHTRRKYKNGCCGVLAYALWLANGKQGSIGIIYREFMGTPQHACYVRDRLWTDIDGPGTKESKLRQWRSTQGDIMDPELFAKRFIDGGEFIADRTALPSAMKLVRQRLTYFIPR